MGLFRCPTGVTASGNAIVGVIEGRTVIPVRSEYPGKTAVGLSLRASCVIEHRLGIRVPQGTRRRNCAVADEVEEKVEPLWRFVPRCRADPKNRLWPRQAVWQ